MDVAMKRWIIRILFFLALGGVTTVGVAWVLAWNWAYDACSWTMDTTWTQSPHGEVEPSIRYWNISPAGEELIRRNTAAIELLVPQRLWDMSTDAIGFDNVGLDFVRVNLSGRFPGRRARWAAEIEATRSGWPTRATGATRTRTFRWSETRIADDSLGGPGSGTGDTGTLVVDSALDSGTLLQNTQCWIGWMPIFPGFLVNTLFYAAIWFGIFFGVAALRRFIRKKRGRCVKCSYDLRGTPGDAKGCPECGWGRASPVAQCEF